MNEAQKIANRMVMLMEERNYPSSVKQMVTGAIKWADNPTEMAREIEPLLQAAPSPKALVKAMQPLIREEGDL